MKNENQDNRWKQRFQNFELNFSHDEQDSFEHPVH